MQKIIPGVYPLVKDNDDLALDSWTDVDFIWNSSGRHRELFINFRELNNFFKFGTYLTIVQSFLLKKTLLANSRLYFAVDRGPLNLILLLEITIMISSGLTNVTLILNKTW